MSDTTFAYHGYQIPIDLLELTGGGTDTWDVISRGHMDEYAKYAPIEPTHHVLEVGCGVGRDAIHLADVIGERGGYLGIDIIAPSIRWCHENITPRHPHFRFEHLDIQSDIHNPHGNLRTRDASLPLPDASTDRILLQSVFTHMFEADIIHYLREFRRVLRAGGKVYATFFIADEESVSMAAKTNQPLLRFEHLYGPGCRVISLEVPESAVGYTPDRLDLMLKQSGLRLDQPIHRGFWCGREGTTDGQDVCIFSVNDDADWPAHSHGPTRSSDETRFAERPSRSLLDRILRR